MPMVSAAIKQELLKLTHADMTVPFIISRISKTTSTEVVDGKKTFKVREPAWDLQAKMHLNAGEYINQEAVDTTLGSFLINKLLIEDLISSIIPNGYYNEVMTNKGFAKVIDMISTAVMEDRLPLDPNVVKFIQNFEFYGLMLCAGVSPSLSPGVFSVKSDIRDKRDVLFAEHGDENISVTDAVKIEDSLIAQTRGILKSDPGMTLFDSGSRGSFEDNYKNMSIMIGPVKNPATGKYDVIKSNYIDGITKKDIPALGNTVVNAAYPKAVGTAEGGYLTKQFYAVYQSVQLDKPGTDCGSKGYLSIFLTDKNYHDYIWQYALDEATGKLELLTTENQKKYTGHTVRLRSPIGCLSDHICNKCMGERFYKLNINNVGLTAGRISNSILNAGMKNFHITKVKLNQVDPNALLI